MEAVAHGCMNFLKLRELGRASCSDREKYLDALICKRDIQPVIADSSPSCRSTYLLKLNPDHKFLAAAHADKSITIYCAATGRMLAKCTGHERSPWTLAFHPSQPYLVSGCLGGSVRLWSLDGLVKENLGLSHLTTQLDCLKMWKHSGAISSVTFHPVHPILAVAWTQEVVFYDWVSGRKLSVWRFVSNQSRVRWVKFNPDGGLLYTATANPSTAHPTEAAHPNKPMSVPNTNSNETSPQITPSKSTHELPDEASKTTSIPRDQLLEFLVSQSDSWFQRIGVCGTCSVRLCCWAGSFKPEFPSSNLNPRAGMLVALRVAELVGKTMRLSGNPLSRLVHRLLSLSDMRSDISEQLRADVHPAAVAVIEDMPAREFLLSRGKYCSRPSSVSEGGLCCGGHACDLVFTHRDLMRRSLCRPCLFAFWRWASRFVNWWHWSWRSEVSSVHANSSSTHRLKTEVMLAGPGQCDKLHASHKDGAGICIQCRARVSPKSKHFSTPQSPCSVSNSSFPADSRVAVHHSLPLAALELLRSRLSNANEVTSVTCMAPDLVAEGKLSKFLRDGLTSSTVTPPPEDVSELLTRLLTHLRSALGSSQPKRPRLDSSDGHSNFTVNQELDGHSVNAPQSSDSATYEVRDLTAEAAELAQLLFNNNVDCSWNRPRPVRIVKASESDIVPVSTLFPYVSAGSHLLRPLTSGSHRTCSLSRENSPTKHRQVGQLTERGSNGAINIEKQSTSLANLSTHSMTACCRCGCIVPQTFPIDPHSSLSAVVCERLALLDDHAHSAVQDTHTKTSVRSGVSRHSGENVLQQSHANNTPLRPSSNELQHGRLTPSSLSRQQDTSMMYLVNRTTGDSMLNAVHRSITEVIAGLFVDMGEHGSANGLQDVTYRVCCWELDLGGPVRYTLPNSSISSEPSDETPDRHRALPMPTNVAVSYNTNSLVIPHARLFNDSSICLSSDGRTIAAFIVPTGNPVTRDFNDETDQFSETILAVYRLQPKERRGHCLFTHRFTTCNPVCLDFSPLGTYLAVGMATTRLPSVSLPTSVLQRFSGTTHTELPSISGPTYPGSSEVSEPNLIPTRHTSVAQIFRLKCQQQQQQVGSRRAHLKTMWSMEHVASVKHPMLLNPISFSRRLTGDTLNNVPSTEPLDLWHRLVLSASTGVSLNTIGWNPNGGLFYGTTKGLVVLMDVQPDPLVPREGEDTANFFAIPEEKVSNENNTLMPTAVRIEA